MWFKVWSNLQGQRGPMVAMKHSGDREKREKKAHAGLNFPPVTLTGLAQLMDT
jgi:hypothetical protein